MMKRRFRGLLVCSCLSVATVLAASGLAPAQTSSQTQYIVQVRRQLNGARDLLGARGFEKTHDYKIATLANGGAKSSTLDLQKGMQYVIIGVCDKDCSDLDIKLYDENDQLIATDTSADDKPLVTVTPRWTGEFRILVSMYRCRNSPCYYGIGVFGN
jgi:hypothetical protein